VTAYMGGRKPLSALRRPDKILITLFSVALAVAMFVGVANYYHRTHLTVEGTSQWYRGNEDQQDPQVMRFPKTVLELLEVTHPHLFFQSIMFFVLCHIFSLSRVSDRRKMWLYGLAFGSVFTEAGLPWLIRFGSDLFSPLLLLSTSVMSISILILLIVPIREMWFVVTKPLPPPRRVRRSPIRSLP
jgi:hypothetical protein